MKQIFSRIARALSQSWAPLPRSYQVDMIIGQVLQKRNIISADQLEHALDVQQEKLSQQGQAISLGMIIVDLGYAAEKDVVAAINDHYELSVSSLSDDIRELVWRKRGTFIERLPVPRVPIWLQLSAVTIFITALTIFMLNYVILTRQEEHLYRQTVEIGMVSINYFASEARIPLLEDDILQLNTLIQNVTSVEGLLYGIIVDQEGMIKAHTDHTQIGKRFRDFENIRNVNHRGLVTYFDYTPLNGKPILNLSQPIKFKDKRLGEVHVGVSIEFIQNVIQEDRSSIIKVTLFVLAFGILVAVLLGFRFTRPISRLVHATHEIGRGNYRHKVNLPRNDELGNLATAFNRMGEDLWKKSVMEKSFGKYVGTEILDLIMANPEDIWLRGHRNAVTTLFADIRGFTSYSDARAPEAIVEALNEYFQIATQAILKHGGYVDKFIGDAVLGVFGVPVYRKNHVERAVRTAIELQGNLKQASRNGNELLSAVGISIDSGEVVSGNIGSEVKMEYTVIGHSVNVAARMNEFAEAGDIIVSQKVLEQLGDRLGVEALPPQQIKGVPESLAMFRVLGLRG